MMPMPTGKLADSFQGLLSAIGLNNGLLQVLSWIGAGVFVMSLAMFLWSKRNGQGNPGLTKGLAWVMMFAGVLATPNVMLPALLNIADLVLDVITNILNKAANK